MVPLSDTSIDFACREPVTAGATHGQAASPPIAASHAAPVKIMYLVVAIGIAVLIHPYALSFALYLLLSFLFYVGNMWYLTRYQWTCI